MEIQMALFRWYKKYSVNNNELDEHHKKLFRIFNRLYDNCLGHESPECINSIIEALISYSNYHFSAEEEHMRNIGYKEIDKHILEHNDFRQKTLQLQQVADTDVPETTKELIIYLKNWLLNHIIIEDKKFSI
jgi:hemerythrin